MEIKHIFIISGKSGLYKLINDNPKMIVVESIVDGSKTPIFSNDKASSLGEICILTTGEDVPLKDVFKIIREKENGAQSISHKSDNNALKSYFEAIVPEYDRNKVYISDMKKVINWYNLLQSAGMLDILEEPEKNEDAETDNTIPEELEGKTVATTQEKVKKTASKKSASTKSSSEKQSANKENALRKGAEGKKVGRVKK